MWFWERTLTKLKLPLAGSNTHTHSLVSVCAVCVVLWFSQPDGAEIWGQTSGTLGISGVCFRVCECACMLLFICGMVTPGWASWSRTQQNNTITVGEQGSDWASAASRPVSPTGQKERGRIHQHPSLTSSASFCYHLWWVTTGWKPHRDGQRGAGGREVTVSARGSFPNLDIN